MRKLRHFNPWLLHFFTLRSQHLVQSPPRHQALWYSLFLQTRTQTFSSPNILVKHCPSPLSVCTVCVCVWGGWGGGGYILPIVQLEPLLTCTLCVILNTRYKNLPPSPLGPVPNKHFRFCGRYAKQFPLTSSEEQQLRNNSLIVFGGRPPFA